jgi:hypothetical protein
MSLRDLRSDLRNIKWGDNKPLVTTPIPSYEDNLSNKLRYGTGGPDFVGRGGTLLPLRIVRDTERITKFLTTVPGVLFTAKQFLLNSTSARGPSNLSRVGNTNNPYLPTNTLAQTIGVAGGLHLNKLGINPFKGLGNGKNYTPGRYVDNSINSKELVNLYNININKTEQGFIRRQLQKIGLDATDILYSYNGGPNSLIGLGNTTIRRIYKTGIDGSESSKIKNLKDGKTYLSQYPSSYKLDNNKNINFQTSPSKLLLSEKYNKIFPFSIIIPTLNNRGTLNENNSVYESELEPRYDLNELGQNPINSPKSHIVNLEKGYLKGVNDNSSFGKLRPNTIKKIGGSLGPLTPHVPIDKRYSKRIHIGDPGLSDGSFTTPLDLINNDTTGTYKDDLVKFRITSINNDNGSDGERIQFRAFIDSFSDLYNSTLNSFKYSGRGENFYKYDGFTRNISINWILFAQSYSELIPMHQKMNWLASNLMPDYNKETGYMMGPLIRMTVGGYIYETPGFISNLTYDISTDAPWEIGINIEDGSYKYDNRVKELPHMIKASLSFTPIHEFLPRKITTLVSNANNKETRFISLDAGEGSNYPN